MRFENLLSGGQVDKDRRIIVPVGGSMGVEWQGCLGGMSGIEA